MTGRILLYGATGSAGRALAAALSDLGDRLVLAGRTEAGVRTFAHMLGREGRVLAADESFGDGLDDIALVINAAGPFARTAEPIIGACLARGIDYCDIAGEWPVFEYAEAQDQLARDRGSMLLPGLGFAIAVTDCLLALAASRFPDTVRLRLALSRPHSLSRGSIETLLAMNNPAVRVRQKGKIVLRPAGSLRHAFDFGEGLQTAVAVSWPDVVTVEKSTGVRTLEVYSAVGAIGETAIRIGAFAAPVLETVAGLGMTGAGSRGQRTARHGMTVIAEAVDRWRRVNRIVLQTADGYSVTTRTVAAAVRAWLGGTRKPGFQTPSGLFGRSFVLDCGAAHVRLASPETELVR